MHARVVRFTDVTADKLAKVVAMVEESDGPPPGVDSVGMELMYDEGQSTALFVGYFEDAEKLRAADEIFQAMDGSETPGTRASVDQCEIKLQRTAGDRS
jgi:hypothetical protein